MEYEPYNAARLVSRHVMAARELLQRAGIDGTIPFAEAHKMIGMFLIRIMSAFTKCFLKTCLSASGSHFGRLALRLMSDTNLGRCNTRKRTLQINKIVF
jgi:hypothetical protein